MGLRAQGKPVTSLRVGGRGARDPDVLISGPQMS